MEEKSTIKLIDSEWLVKYFSGMDNDEYLPVEYILEVIKHAPKAKRAYMDSINIQWFFDYLDSLPEDSPSRIALINMFVAWKKHLEEKEKNGV